jgi:5-methylcytosine-specific restriction endonuclease McrA
MSNRIRQAFYYRDNNIRSKKRIPTDILFTRNSNYSRDNVKVRIITENLIPYVCSMCDAEPEWKGKPLILVLDHINGINNDNRLENLRFLCPNCNSQTETFSKNLKYRKPIQCEEITEIEDPYENKVQPLIFGD